MFAWQFIIQSIINTKRAMQAGLIYNNALLKQKVKFEIRPCMLTTRQITNIYNNNYYLQNLTVLTAKIFANIM